MRKGAPSASRLFGGKAVWLVVLAAAAVYANALTAGFTLDDVPIVQENPLVTSLGNLGTIFRTNYWGESSQFPDKSLYRPLTITSYALNYAAHGLNPMGYHLVNVVLHVLVAVLFFLYIKDLFRREKLAFAAAIFFAVHPIHTEAVSGVVGRAEILALLGTLLCLWGYERAREASQAGMFIAVRWWMAISVLGLAIGSFSKEIGILAPAMIIVTETMLPEKRWLFSRNRRAIFLFFMYTVVIAMFFMMRADAVQTTNMNIGFLELSKQDRIWTALTSCVQYVWLLIVPLKLSAEYWVHDIHVAHSPVEPGVLAAFALLAGTTVFIARFRYRYPIPAWGSAFFLITLFPVSNIPFPIGVMMAERILYTPSVGFVVLLGGLFGLWWMKSKDQRTVWAVFWVVVILFGARTWFRNYDWQTNYALATVTLQTSPNSPVFNSIMADWYRDQNKNDTARAYLLKVIQEQRDNASALFNLGNIDLDEQRFDRAIEYFRKSIGHDPNNVATLNNLGMAYLKSQRFDGAVQTFRRVRDLRPNEAGGYLNLVSAYVQMGNAAAALPLAEETVRRFPRHAGAYWNLGAVYQMSGRKQEADAAFARAALIDPSVRTTQDTKGIMQ